jgi:hypothetical protein
MPNATAPLLSYTFSNVLTTESKQRLSAIVLAVFSLRGTIFRHLPSTLNHANDRAYCPVLNSQIPAAIGYSGMSIKVKGKGAYSLKVWLNEDYQPISVTVTRLKRQCRPHVPLMGPKVLPVMYNEHRLAALCNTVLATPHTDTLPSFAYTLADKVAAEFA